MPVIVAGSYFHKTSNGRFNQAWLYSSQTTLERGPKFTGFALRQKVVLSRVSSSRAIIAPFDAKRCWYLQYFSTTSVLKKEATIYVDLAVAPANRVIERQTVLWAAIYLNTAAH